MNFKFLKVFTVVIILFFSLNTKAGMITENWQAEVSFTDSTGFTVGQLVYWSVVYDNSSLVMHRFDDATGAVEYTWDASCPGTWCVDYSMFADAIFETSDIYNAFAANIPVNFSGSDQNITNYSRTYKQTNGANYYDYIKDDFHFYVSTYGNGGYFEMFMRDGDNNVDTSRQIDVVNMKLAEPVPEPSTLAIFALGMMGLASRRFKRN